MTGQRVCAADSSQAVSAPVRTKAGNFLSVGSVVLCVAYDRQEGWQQ